MPILGYISAGLGILLLVAGMQIRYLNLEVETLENNQETLEDAIIEQKATIKTQTALADASVLREADLEQDLAAAKDIATGFSNEINNIRATEHEKALLAPYERGLASASRLGSLWMRIEYTKNNDSINPDSAKTDDTRSPDN